MEIRQGITPEGWSWIIEAIGMKRGYNCEEDPIPDEVSEVLTAMLMLAEVKSACPAIKLTLKEKEDG